MKYTIRTCHKCGLRDIQPNMVRRNVEYEWGSSTTGLQGRTLIGSLLGEKKSTREVKKFLWHPSKRKYRRVKTVFECANCYGMGVGQPRQLSLENLSIGKALKFLIIIFIGWNILLGIFRELSKKENDERVDATRSAQTVSSSSSSQSLAASAYKPESSIAASATDLRVNDPSTKNALEGQPAAKNSEAARTAEAQSPSSPSKPIVLAKIKDMPSSDEFYSTASKRDGEQGAVMVKVCVNSDGKIIGSPTVLESSGFERLDESAVRLARAGRYQAGTVGEEPLPESCVPFRVRFVLY